MGYMRPTSSWNIGKRGEWADRRFFTEATSARLMAPAAHVDADGPTRGRAHAGADRWAPRYPQPVGVLPGERDGHCGEVGLGGPLPPGGLLPLPLGPFE